jgi:predicted Zn finger-like uncharacterized protein
MSMATQCPSCDTTFRVTPQQLQAQHGMVRCGRCATVFDGFKALATLPEAVTPETAVPEPAAPIATAPVAVEATAEVLSEPAAIVETPHQTTPDEPLPIDVATAAVEPEPIETVAAVAASNAPAEESDAPGEAVVTESVPEAEAEPEIETIAAPTAESSQPNAIETTLPLPEVPARPRRRGGWAVGAVAMLLLLCAQLVYLNRGDIAAAVPESRAFLTEWCKPLHCTVALPQRPRQINIEASDMQAADAANPGLIILTATLRNQAGVTLGYPALDVVLTNTRDHTVARRIFLPEEYLADSKAGQAGMAPSMEVTIRLNIDSGDLGAAGFRLELMAAPTT